MNKTCWTLQDQTGGGWADLEQVGGRSWTGAHLCPETAMQTACAAGTDDASSSTCDLLWLQNGVSAAPPTLMAPAGLLARTQRTLRSQALDVAARRWCRATCNPTVRWQAQGAGSTAAQNCPLSVLQPLSCQCWRELPCRAAAVGNRIV